MIAQNAINEYDWSTLPEPRGTSEFTSSYLYLLSALDKGWEISRTELQPSWDQNGFVYRVIIREPYGEKSKEIILPRNEAIEEILEKDGVVC